MTTEIIIDEIIEMPEDETTRSRTIIKVVTTAIKEKTMNKISYNIELEQCVRRLTSSVWWKISKVISILIYAWFVFGMIWVVNSTYCKECPGLYRVVIVVIFA